MNKIIYKVFLAVFPLIILTILYFVNDPFKVLYHYDCYFPRDGIQYVVPNNDFTATQTLLNNYKSYNYDSYIFGSSKGLLFHVQEWKKHIPNGKHFQFSVSKENLWGIERKLNLIDSLGLKINNVLLVLDYDVYGIAKEDIRFAKHPVLTGRSYFQFELNTFKGFFESTFLLKYLKLLIFRKAEKTIWASELNCNRQVYDPVTNDVEFPDIEKDIDRDTSTYYRMRASIFGERPLTQHYTKQVIETDQQVLLMKIKNIFNKHKTNYKLVICPLYDQLKIDTNDYKMLCAIFDSQNIYDYSGINHFTNDKHNYYESTHFRKFVATKIMDSIYVDEKSALSPAKIE